MFSSSGRNGIDRVGNRSSEPDHPEQSVGTAIHWRDVNEVLVRLKSFPQRERSPSSQQIDLDPVGS